MTRWLALIWIMVGAGALAASPRQPPVSVTVSRAEAGSWIATFRFGEDAGAWAFPHSNPDMDGKPWRSRTWTILTPGVRLVRTAGHDAFVADRGTVPRTVRVRFTPFTGALRAEYDPALVFSDGGIAFYSDHFLSVPFADAGHISGLNDADGKLDERPTTVRFRDPGKRLLVRGQVTRDVAILRPGQTDTYVYIGAARVVETPALAAIVDPGLPAWLKTELDAFTPRLLALYREKLGIPAGGRPMALVSWNTGERGSWSMSGGTLNGLVMMAMSGERVMKVDADSLERARWFLGHETAHFWFGQTVDYDSRRQAWITEGAADLLAVRARARLVPGSDPRPDLQNEVDDCLRLAAGGKSLAGAEERGETRMNYACGAALALAGETLARKAGPDADEFTFLRRLLDRSRARGKVGVADWTATYVAAGGDAALAARIAAFAADGTADPVALFVDVFAQAGVRFTRDGAVLKLS